MGFRIFYALKVYRQVSRKKTRNMTSKLVNFLESQSYKDDFKEFMKEMENKYGSGIIEECGIGSQLDISAMSKHFFNSNVTADVSVDSNANVSDISVISHKIEMAKPFQLINSYYRIYKELKKSRGIDYAKKIIESQISGRIYINDFHAASSGMAYCFNYSTYDTALMGIPNVFDGRGGSKPPKSLMSFLGQIELFSLIAGNSTLGATGLADLLIVMSIYMDKLLTTGKEAHFILDPMNGNELWSRELNFNSAENCWQYAESILTGFIYRLNQPYRGSQSLFSNVSIFDEEFLKGLIPSYTLEIDGQIYSAKMDIVKKMQKVYIDIMNRELARKPITFPVTTACFSVDENHKIIDRDFLKYISEENLKFGFINIYCGKSSTLSSCCFDGSQKVLTKSSNGVALKTIKEIIDGDYSTYRKNFTVFHNGSWCSAKTLRLSKENHKMFKIKTANNKEMIVTDNHVHLVLGGNKETTELTTEDYIAFNTRALDTYPEADRKLTYEQGVLIGAYLGDGSKYKREGINSCEVTFSLSEGKLHLLDTLAKALKEWNIDSELKLYEGQHHVKFVKVYSTDLYDLINEYVLGDYAFEKELDSIVFTQSKEFRKGILDGLYATDGGNNNRIYSSSKLLIESIEALCTTLGINTIINVDTRKDHGYIRGEKVNTNFDVYCIRWYSSGNKRGMGTDYKVINNTDYFKIVSIEEVKTEDSYVYCFQMVNEFEPYFTLPNGIITHNCRLRSEQDNEYFNSFGAGSTKIGSLGVSSGNLPQLAFRVKDKENARELFLEQLRELVIDCGEVNNAKRNLIRKAIKAGAQPLYSLGYMDLKRQYSTFGVVGLYEALEILGMNIKTEEGKNFVLRMLDIINTTNKELQIKFKAPHNCEQIPAENVAVKLAKKDRIMGLNTIYDLYSNQFIPLIERTNMLDRIELQGLFDKHFSGGAICHINMDQEISDSEVMSSLIETCANKGVVYFAINYVLQECEDGHMSVGNVDTCPICGKPITGKYTRVVGFLTKVNNWNKTRREYDFPNRQFYGSAKLSYAQVA